MPRRGGMVVQIARHQITLAVADPPDTFGHGGQAAYGFLLEVCRRFEPALARAIHDGDGPKPLSLSPLDTLSASATAGVAAALQAAREDRVALDLSGAEAHIRAVESLCASYHDLHDRASQSRSIELQFASPTLFRRSGVSLVLPRPELLFQSLLRTWNAFSPMQFPPHDQAEFATIMVGGHHRTRMTDFSAYRLLGFLRRVKFPPPDGMHLLLRHHQLPCRLRFFAGVGYKTTMARRLPTYLKTTIQEEPRMFIDGLDYLPVSSLAGIAYCPRNSTTVSSSSSTTTICIPSRELAGGQARTSPSGSARGRTAPALRLVSSDEPGLIAGGRLRRETASSHCISPDTSRASTMTFSCARGHDPRGGPRHRDRPWLPPLHRVASAQARGLHHSLREGPRPTCAPGRSSRGPTA